MKFTEATGFNQTTTLAQRLAEGRLTVAEALRYAIHLADAVRKLHDTGRWHGALSPSNLSLHPNSVELLAPPEGLTRMVTPYSAPEVIQGSPADTSSDIFSFGTILFEMLTGRRAFEGDSRAALAAQITKAPAPTSGSAAIDRLVGQCLAKNPDARTPRVQKILMELKLISAAARHSGHQGATISLHREGPSPDAALARAEMQQLEAKLAARLQLHERTIAEMHRSAAESVTNVKLQMAALNSNIVLGRTGTGDTLDDSAGSAIQARIDRGFEVLNARVTAMERTVEEMRRKAVQFEHNIAADLVDIEHGLKLQTAAIDSARTAMSQTDDLVERVVEVLESLQTSVLDQDEPPVERAHFVVN